MTENTYTIMIYHQDRIRTEMLNPLLNKEEIRILHCSGEEAVEQTVRRERIHLLLLDVSWDKAQCIRQIRKIRRQSCIPIVVCSIKGEEQIKIAALDAGADDYVTMPCSMPELAARIKSQIRRYTQLSNLCENISRIYKVDDLEVDDIRRKVTVQNREVYLTPIEYKILRLLVKEKGRVLSIDQIYEAIWNMQAIGADNTIAVHIRHIREKIEENPRQPRYLKVVWGTGYKVG